MLLRNGPFRTMGLLDRLSRILRSSLNSVLSNSEDPERILEQTVADMQGDLIQIRQSVAQAIATQKRTERQCDHAQTNAQEYYHRAQLALQRGDEAIARDCLERRQTYLRAAQAMAAQQQQQQTVVAQLKENMRMLESKLAEAKTKKDLYIARARSAQASARLNEMLGQVGGSGSTGAFNQMEEKILALEARSDAIAELNTLSENSQLEKKFSKLANSPTDVETELADLKAKLGGHQDISQLPPPE
jgi:phage shock protein A